MAEDLDDDALAFAHRMFDLRATGGPTSSVTSLPCAGADPAQGSPSAVATATFFELPVMLALLQRPQPDSADQRHGCFAQASA